MYFSETRGQIRRRRLASVIIADSRDDWPEVDLENVSVFTKIRCALGGHRRIVDTGERGEDGPIFSCRCGKYCAGIDWM